jgi:hypothetical protein
MVRTSHQVIIEIPTFNEVQRLLASRIKDQKKSKVRILDMDVQPALLQ